MGKSDGRWISILLLKPFHSILHPLLLGVGTNLFTIGSQKPAMRK